MNDQTIKDIVEELARVLKGHAFGKIFQLSRAVLAIDLRMGNGRYLLLSVEPNNARIHLIGRTARELEKASLAPFALLLRKYLGGASLENISKDEGDRVVRFAFSIRDEVGIEHKPTLVTQLTGRTSNLLLLDDTGHIIDALRPSRGAGQQVGDVYVAPASPNKISVPSKETALARGEFNSLSEAADNFYQQLERTRAFEARAASLSARLQQEINKRRKLCDNLERDLARHGDAETHKRIGDLLLSNIANAVRTGGIVRVQDYYAEGAPIIELEIDENKSLQQEAAAAFARYGKSKRAAQEIAQRLESTTQELADLADRLTVLRSIIEEHDEAALSAFETGATRGSKPRQKDRASSVKSSKKDAAAAAIIPGVRRYLSSDGYEILVGRGARDNEHLTFRLARSSDTWLHAADYPGSHVVVRNARKDADIPPRTLIEAAQLAAHFSQAREESKAAVNYTQRKFVTKIKGAAPGLVRLASFRTILVEPHVMLERI